MTIWVEAAMTYFRTEYKPYGYVKDNEFLPIGSELKSEGWMMVYRAESHLVDTREKSMVETWLLGVESDNEVQH